MAVLEGRDPEPGCAVHDRGQPDQPAEIVEPTRGGKTAVFREMLADAIAADAEATRTPPTTPRKSLDHVVVPEVDQIPKLGGNGDLASQIVDLLGRPGANSLNRYAEDIARDHGLGVHNGRTL
jgi:hypothetical protein